MHTDDKNQEGEILHSAVVDTSKLKVGALTTPKTSSSPLERGMNQPETLDLPVLSYEEQIKDLIRNHQVAIIIGATGSGKTTEIGRMMSEIINGKIATTQPRRPAAVTVAEYVASKKGQQLGGDVGYHIRFNDTTNKGTILDYVTDGILIEQLLAAKVLPEYSGIILDEAHIRNLNVDFLMGLILGVNDKRREIGMTELKILITSATIPALQFSEFFGGAPILEIPGKMYPVSEMYEKQKPKDYIRAAAQKVKQIIHEGIDGDVLIFMPGEAEIRQTINLLRDLSLGSIEILPFFGQQSLMEQEKVFASYSARKVIVATNIAETSLTIPGVRVVIDPGLQRSSIYDPKTGISRLEDENASMAAINQRRGRAGRTDTGICFRLFSEKEERPKFDIPEIQRTDLAGIVLKMKRLGIVDVLNFRFIDPPEKAQIRKAVSVLKILGALDDEENITEIGKIMANLPLDPHIARMVIEANKYGCVEAISTIAAFMSSKSVFDRSSKDFNAMDAAHNYFKFDDYGKPLSDPQTNLRVFEKYSQHRESQAWVTQNHLNFKVLQEIELIRDDLISTLRRHNILLSKIQDPVGIAKSVLAGNIGNLLERVTREDYQRMVGVGDEITIHPSSSLRNGLYPQFMVAGEIMTNASGFTSAFQCQAVELAWLPEVGSQILNQKIASVEYNSKMDDVLEVSRFYLKNDGRELLTQRKVLEKDQRAVTEFASYLSSLTTAISTKTKAEFSFIEHFQDLRLDVQEYHVKSSGWVPELTQEALEQIFIKKFTPLMISSKKDLRTALKNKEIDLHLSLKDFISPDKAQKIDEQNPEFILSNGKKYSVSYYKNKKKFMVRVEIPTAEILEMDIDELDLSTLLKSRSKSQIMIKAKSSTKNYPSKPLDEFEELVTLVATKTVPVPEKNTSNKYVKKFRRG